MRQYSETEKALLAYTASVLKTHIEKHNISALALARKAKLSHPTVLNFLKGNGVGFITAYRIFRAAGLELSSVVREWEP